MEQGFDEKLKESLIRKRVTIPGRTEQVIRETLESLPEKKRRNPKRLLAAAVVFVLASSAFLTIHPHTMAENIPLLHSIQKYFNLDNQYVKVMEPSALSQESNGIKVSILNTVFDGVELLVSYKVESDKAFETKPILFTQAIINSKDEGWLSASNEYGEFTDKNQMVYEGVTRFTITPESLDWRKGHMGESIDIAKLPEVFTLKLHIDRLGGINGKIPGDWNFDVRVSALKAKEFAKEVTINKQLTIASAKAELEKVIVTPTRIYLAGKAEESASLLDYLIVDEKGQEKKWLGGETREYKTANGTRSYYGNNGKEPSALTIIPFIYNKSPDFTKGVPLNKDGVTTIALDEKRSLTVTDAFQKNGKTYLVYKASSPVNSYLPFFLFEKNGEQFNRNLYDSNQASIGNETVLVFNGNLLDKELLVVNPNKVYYEKAFDVKIP